MKNVPLILFVLNVFVSFSIYPAKVYYLGQSSTTPSQINPSYTLSQRIQDLLDFSLDRDYGQRSGRLSGTITQEINWQKIGGNKSKSFLEEGTDYLSEINLNLQEKLFRDYNFEGQWFLRKTDNRRIESKKDIRLKQINLKVFNSHNLFEFGDFYGDFSPFVLGASLEGFNIRISPQGAREYYLIAARKGREDTTTEQFQRNVFGFKINQQLFKNSGLFSNFRIGLQTVTIQDDSSTSYDNGNAKDLKNTVASFDGEISFTKYFSFQYELARSIYLEDEDSLSIRDTEYATALRLQPKVNLGKIYLTYLYYYVQPKFYTDLGSAANDKIQHQLNIDYRVNPKASVNFVENYYWDHLSGSSQTQRTINNEKYISINLKPFESRKNLSLRPYFNYQERNSDDQINSKEAVTKTIGFGINDVLNEKTNLGINYEYRGYTDEGNDKANSDYSHRLTCNFSHEQNLFKKRLYYSISPSFERHRAKSEENIDFNVSVSFNGQYNLFENTQIRFGHNIQNTNNARPNADFLNNRSFLEYDVTLQQKRNTHLVFRLERNRYDHEDGSQEYRETRFIMRFVSNF